MVHVTYYTDPACPWSWAAEPALRRVLVEFGEGISVTYVMGGLARDLDDPAHELEQTLEASAASAMPVDPRVWVDRPPRSTYPACQAVKAAAEQDLAGPMLRVLRERVMVDRAAIDSAPALTEAARGVDGMDLARFEIDLASHASVEAFGADLERSRSVPEEQMSPGTGRASFPTFQVGETWTDAGGLRDAVVAAGAVAQDLPGVADALGRFPRLAAAEVAAICGIPRERATAELWQLAADWKARPERVLASELWRATH